MATVGTQPVNRFTIAASAIFSNGLRAAPGWANTLKRVPEFPYAHEGVSMRSERNVFLTWLRSVMVRGLLSESCEVEDLLEPYEALVGLFGRRGSTKNWAIVACHRALTGWRPSLAWRRRGPAVSR